MLARSAVSFCPTPLGRGPTGAGENERDMRAGEALPHAQTSTHWVSWVIGRLSKASHRGSPARGISRRRWQGRRSRFDQRHRGGENEREMRVSEALPHAQTSTHWVSWVIGRQSKASHRGSPARATICRGCRGHGESASPPRLWLRCPRPR